MEKLRELAKLVTPNKTKSITVIGNGKDAGTKLDHLYRLLASGEVSTDEEAFRALYPDATRKNAYYKLKHELRNRLYNSVFFLDAKKSRGTDRQDAFVRCQFLIALGAFLQVGRAWTNVASVTRTAYELATKYELTNEAISTVRRLMLLNRTRGDRKRVDAYTLELLELSRLQEKELLAEVYWTQINKAFVEENSYKQSLPVRAANYAEMLDNIPIARESLKLIYLDAAIRAAAAMTAHDYAGAVPILEAALDRIVNYERFQDRVYTYTIAVNLLACHISLKQHPEARRVLRLLEENVVAGTYNWFKVKELHFTLALHTQRYAEAAMVHRAVSNHPDLKRQPAVLRESWTVYSAYLQMLYNADLISEEQSVAKRRFRIARFVNELPIYARDKRGHNITVLVAQIVLLLQQGKFDALIDRFEAINKYRERYVSRETNFRGNVFLHMLREVTRNDFNRPAVLAATADLRAKLDEEPIDILSPGYDQEILPYEDLWEVLLRGLPE